MHCNSSPCHSCPSHPVTRVHLCGLLNLFSVGGGRLFRSQCMQSEYWTGGEVDEASMAIEGADNPRGSFDH